MTACEYRDWGKLPSVFSAHLEHDHEGVLAALRSATLFACPDAIPIEADDLDRQVWVTHLAEGGSAVVRIRYCAPLEDLSLSVVTRSCDEVYAASLHDRIVRLAEAMIEVENDGHAAAAPLTLAGGDPNDDLPF